MSQISKKKLKTILEKHKKWLYDKEEGERANLSGSDLRRANLSGSDLRGANLYGSDLSGSDLRGANLYGSDLSGSDLRGANLIGANLSKANLIRANLSKANLIRANLSKANLSYSNLRGANLYGTLNINIPLVCPEKGSFIGFKKAGNYIVELLIIENSKRSSATSRKCRCSEAKVISITNLDGTDSGIIEVLSNFDDSFIYRVGEIVKEPSFDNDRWNECSKGIHFFITREEAVNY